MRLLMLPRYDALGASSRLRLLQYVPALEAAGIVVDVAPLLADNYVRDLYSGRVSIAKVAWAYVKRVRQMLSLGRYDVVWLEKEIWPWLPAPLEMIWLRNSTRLLADYDDAVFHRYNEHRSGLVRLLLGKKIDSVMRRANLVTAGNEYLAAHARCVGAAHVVWLPTVIDLLRYPSRKMRTEEGPAVIGWIGSPATADYLRILTPALLELSSRYNIRCVAIGARPDQVADTPFEALEWHEDREVALLGQLDIGVMPLPDGHWERGKCGYKLIQYMACGLPVVASPVGVNSDIVLPGENGYLATTTEEWTAMLEQLVVNEKLRLQMGAAGRLRVEEVYSLQAQVPRIVKMLVQVVGNGSSSCVD